MWGMKLLTYFQTSTVQLKFRDRMSNFMPHFTGHVITYPWWESMFVKGAPGQYGGEPEDYLKRPFFTNMD